MTTVRPTLPLRRSAFGSARTSQYDEQVLEPRAWTLAQSEWAADLLASCADGPLLEICSGAGQIGLAAAALSGRAAVLVDASGAGVRVRPAQRRRRRAGRPRRRTPRADDRGAGARGAVPAGARRPAVHPLRPTRRVFPDDPLTAIDGGDDGLDLARLCLEVGARAPGARGPPADPAPRRRPGRAAGRRVGRSRPAAASRGSRSASSRAAGSCCTCGAADGAPSDEVVS